MQLTVLAGGVGAARFLDGLVRVVPPEQVTAIGNVADDFEILGLHVSPDLDTVVYTLAGVVEPKRGWGRAGETANALAVVRQLGGPDWFFLGDLDIGLHLVRTERLRGGERLSEITRDLREGFGLGIELLPATDDPVKTVVVTDVGELDFQTWFVGRRHEDEVRAVRYDGARKARPAPGVVSALERADAVIVAPSNPFLSVDPILAVPGVRETITARRGPTVAVSPIVGGKAVKGPADRMFRSLEGESSAIAVARHYAGFLTHLLVDRADAAHVTEMEQLGVTVRTADTLMVSAEARVSLAREVLALVGLIGT